MTSKPFGIRRRGERELQHALFARHVLDERRDAELGHAVAQRASFQQQDVRVETLAVKPFEHVDQHVLRPAEPAVRGDEEHAHPSAILPLVFKESGQRRSITGAWSAAS